jgi:hypothetical protein
VNKVVKMFMAQKKRQTDCKSTDKIYVLTKEKCFGHAFTKNVDSLGEIVEVVQDISLQRRHGLDML